MRFPKSITVILALLTLSNASANETIIRAWASADYIAPEADTTCAFLEGRYFAAAYSEDSPPAISFEEVATILSTHLAEQGFVMAPEAASADLVLVVNWGETMTDDDLPDLDTLPVGAEDEPVSSGLVSESRRAKNAELLGIGEIREGPFETLRDRQLKEATAQERYLIQLIAYSMPKLKARKPGSTTDPEWATIFSIPVYKRDIAEAMETISGQASAYFGRDLEDLSIIRKGEKQAIVEIGELEFIEYLDENEPSPGDVPKFDNPSSP